MSDPLINPNEYTTVELPFIQQLQGMGWHYLEGDKDIPELTERSSFREVLLVDRLRDAIRRINLDNGCPWLDDQRVNQTVGALERLGETDLMEANQAGTALLLSGTTVTGDSVLHDGREQTVRYIDFE